MPEFSEDLARDTDGQAPGRGVVAGVTGEPMPHDQPGPDETHGPSRALPPSEAETSPPRRRPFYTRPLLMAVLLLGGAIAGVSYWQYARQYESTDDAFIEGHIIQISPKVPAQVTRVLIDDNQEVKQGDLLIELDPRDFEVGLEQAQTNGAAARGRL